MRRARNWAREEELEDIRLYDVAKQEAGEAVSFEQAVKEIEQDSGK